MRGYAFIWLLASMMGCSAQNHSISTPGKDTLIVSFPGAEGFGKYSSGGRGGVVMIVTNTNDAGAGSFRAAAESKLKRIIVFAVSGTIHLESKLVIQGNCTIAGQTAPGGGICLADQPVGLGGDNIVIRYLRFRMGDKYQSQKGMVDGSGGDDAFGGTRRKNILIDHCSVSWSTDECLSVYAGDSTTLQWNIISEPLNYSYHFEEGDKDFERHGFGGIWGGRHLSAHHNLFAHCVSRNPRFNGARLGADQELVDFRNNVIYNWGTNNVYGGESGKYNVVGNYYKYGPSTNKNVRSRIVNPTRQEKPLIDFGRFYVDANFVDGDPQVSQQNEMGVHVQGGDTDKKMVLVNQPFASIELKKQSAEQAYQDVLNQVGASLPLRDTLDLRIINNVKTRTGRIIDVQGGFEHGTEYAKTIGAWPALMSLPAPADTDQDGIPDEWERKHNLNPADPTDATKLHQSGYTLIELYINSLVK